jgi:hydrogenase maturation protease
MSEIDQSNLPDFCRKPTLVLGCGNILFGDDGFGCAVVDYIEAHYRVPEAVCLLDVGTGVRKLLFTLCLSPARPERLLILDAIDAGRSSRRDIRDQSRRDSPGQTRRFLNTPVTHV